MNSYIIIEIEDGFAVTSVPEGTSAESVARQRGGEVVDEGPYDSFEKAQEVLLTMPNPYEPDE